jgi:hypothetical protein
MSVIVVTDDAVDDNNIQTHSLNYVEQSAYKQLKQLEYDLSASSSRTSFAILVPSPSIIIKSNPYYRQHRRRRYRRLQSCLVQHSLTYMLTLLFITHHIHWPMLVLSLSSMTFISAHASSANKSFLFIDSNREHQLLSSASSSSSSFSTTKTTPLNDDAQQCLPIHRSYIELICSKTCRAQRTPTEKMNDIHRVLSEILYLPFCSHYLLYRSISSKNFLNETSEHKCQQILHQLITFDEEAREASYLFATYMKAIDSASKENRYSIIDSDCQVEKYSSTVSSKYMFVPLLHFF